MGAADVLAEIKRLAALGRILFTQHARERMNERTATVRDVTRALRTATSARAQRDRESWRVEGGTDLDGDDLTIVVAVEADVIVVTLF